MIVVEIQPTTEGALMLSTNRTTSLLKLEKFGSFLFVNPTGPLNLLWPLFPHVCPGVS